MNESKDFYRNLSSSYDQMTSFDNRLKSLKPDLEKIHTRYGFSSVLDVACGTGLHAILFAKMGLRVTGADVSPEMLEVAQHNAIKSGVKIQWIQSSMQEIEKLIQDKFQSVFCLGNSIPHLLTEQDLHQSISAFYQILEPGGFLLLQLLNYHKILSEKNRIVGINKKNDKTFIRFYDFQKNTLIFNVLHIEWKSRQAQYTLESTQLHPYKKETLMRCLKQNKFSDIEIFEDLSLNPYHPDRSKNVVISARRMN
jgi:ubiquinone/menaquinone biosynthesis C-methylase UbiE